MAGLAHFRGIEFKDRFIMGLNVLRIDFRNLIADLVTVFCGSLLGHAQAAVDDEAALQGCIELQAHNGLMCLVNKAGAMGNGRGNRLRIHIQHAALSPFLGQQILAAFPHSRSVFRSVR